MKAFKNDIRRIYARAKRLVVLGLVALFVSDGALAQSMTIDGTTTAYGRMVYRQQAAAMLELVPSYNANEAAWVEMGQSLLTADGTNKLNLARSGQLTNPSGNKFTVNAASKVSGATLAPLIKKALPLVPVLGTGVALYDLIKELGFDASGGNIVKPSGVTPPVAVTSQATGESIMGKTWNGQFVNTPYLCHQVTSGGTYAIPGNANAHWKVTLGGLPTPWPPAEGGAYIGPCYMSGQSQIFYMTRHNIAAPVLPSSAQEVADAIAAKSGWPVSSNLPKATVDAIGLTGDRVATETPTITGPASSTGPSSSTTNPDGSTVTKNTTYIHNYAGNPPYRDWETTQTAS